MNDVEIILDVRNYLTKIGLFFAQGGIKSRKNCPKDPLFRIVRVIPKITVAEPKKAFSVFR